MQRLLNLIRTYWSACTLFTLTGITVLSLSPLEKLPPAPGGDKTHHLIAYALLAFPTALRRPQHWQILCLLFIACGGIIELIQPYVNRYGEWLDFAANSAGVLCGLLFAELLIRRRFLSDPPAPRFGKKK
jgi:hypothetical protein